MGAQTCQQVAQRSNAVQGVTNEDTMFACHDLQMSASDECSVIMPDSKVAKLTHERTFSIAMKIETFGTNCLRAQQVHSSLSKLQVMRAFHSACQTIMRCRQ